MLHSQNTITVELLRIKNSTFALVFEDKSDNIEAINKVINSLPNCCFDEERLRKVQLLYNDIRENRCVSLEDVYAVFDIDCDDNTPLFCNHKRQYIKEYRQLIANILDETIEQFKKNTHIIDMPKLAHSIFYKAQEFTEEKPKFISNLWFIGNATQANAIMKDAFESYTTAPIELKQNPKFCTDRLVQLMEAYKFSIKDSFRVHYLDGIVDQIYTWYFIESETRPEYMIFIPDSFDPIREFLLDFIDENPFILLLRSTNNYYEKITTSETCLDADNLLFIPVETFNDVKCFRELHKMYDLYFRTHTALKQHGMYNCKCYDITSRISSSFAKSPSRRKIHISLIEPEINEKNLIYSHENIVYDKVEFIRNIIKPNINRDFGLKVKSA